MASAQDPRKTAPAQTRVHRKNPPPEPRAKKRPEPGAPKQVYTDWAAI